MIIWHPKDARLYWQLGELYNAEGEIELAAKILDGCTFNMGYSNPNLMRNRQALREEGSKLSAQRTEVRQAEAEQRKREDEDEKQREFESRKRFWWILSIGVALGLMLVYYQFREVIRKFRRVGAKD